MGIEWTWQFNPITVAGTLAALALASWTAWRQRAAVKLTIRYDGTGFATCSVKYPADMSEGQKEYCATLVYVTVGIGNDSWQPTTIIRASVIVPDGRCLPIERVSCATLGHYDTPSGQLNSAGFHFGNVKMLHGQFERRLPTGDYFEGRIYCIVPGTPWAKSQIVDARVVVKDGRQKTFEADVKLKYKMPLKHVEYPIDPSEYPTLDESAVPHFNSIN